tara:strand:+ start:348 stop:803 length:456 start_codon:yes stop_codon:yes gene_type:complete
MEIIGYPNYLIYEDGRVWSKKTNIFMKTYTLNTGYKSLRLCEDGKAKSFLLHRLIAINYIPNEDNKTEVDHKNNDTLDNRIENLRWCDRSENNQNTRVSKNNKLQIKNICYDKAKNRYKYVKEIRGNVFSKSFKTLEEAIEYKQEYESNNF